MLRMGEALVLDWDSKAYDALFGATTADDPRGADSMKSIELLDDPELQEKKEKRAARRKHGINLDECFNESSKSEVLSEDNAWYCSRCKERRRATKTLEIWTVPDILIIHLKRFSGARNFRDKIEGKDLTYDLFAVDNHFGGLGGGHYTATAQNFFDKQWYDYNGKPILVLLKRRYVHANFTRLNSDQMRIGAESCIKISLPSVLPTPFACPFRPSLPSADCNRRHQQPRL